MAGWRLRSLCGTKRVVLELGGNAAAYVDDSADLDRAVAALVPSAFAYAGQVCIKAQRILVAREVEEAFTAAFLEAARAMEPGDPDDAGTVLGPMIDAESAERVEGWVEEARRKGARVLLAPRREGARLSPAVLSGAPAGSLVREREIFGPAATIDAFSDLAGAFAAANDSAYGLQASIFTRDIRSALAAFDSLEVGGVIVNEPPTLRIDNFPYGGVKASGFGREGIRFAIEEMTEPRTLYLKP